MLFAGCVSVWDTLRDTAPQTMLSQNDRVRAGFAEVIALEDGFKAIPPPKEFIVDLIPSINRVRMMSTDGVVGLGAVLARRPHGVVSLCFFVGLGAVLVRCPHGVVSLCFFVGLGAVLVRCPHGVVSLRFSSASLLAGISLGCFRSLSFSFDGRMLVVIFRTNSLCQ